MDIWLRNARVVTCAGPDGATAAERLGVIDCGAIGVKDGRIAWVGPDAEVHDGSVATSFDLEGSVVLPGLVDPHTHLVFAGSRIAELARKMAGEDYRTIAAEGGGIASTVRATRAANDETLYARARARAEAMRTHGTTTVEIKSGYGLTLADELRLLAVGRRLATDRVVRTTTTFLGAHTVPPERRDDRAGYVAEVAAKMIPEAAARGLADACDVYLDDGAFTLDESRVVLEAARAAGLRLRAHIGQFADVGGAELLAELGALSGDHLEHVSDAGLAAMAHAGVVAVLLPGAWRTLRQTPPDAGRLRAAGVRMAIGTDCNPGTSPCTDLPLCAALAMRDAGLTAEEALLGVTVEAARAIGLGGVGKIAFGAWADLAVYECDDPRALTYPLGDVRAARVFLGGREIERATRTAPLW